MAGLQDIYVNCNYALVTSKLIAHISAGVDTLAGAARHLLLLISNRERRT